MINKRLIKRHSQLIYKDGSTQSQSTPPPSEPPHADETYSYADLDPHRKVRETDMDKMKFTTGERNPDCILVCF